MHKQLWFIAILPDGETEQRVRSIQLEIADRFGPRRILKIPAHITLEPPFRYEDNHDTHMPMLLADFFAKQKSFSLELRNFGSFRQSVVFIEVTPSLPLLEMQADLSRLLREDARIIREEPWYGGYTPHMTVANRDVTPATHERIWREFNTRKFYATFKVNEICLLQHDGAAWQVHSRFPVQEVP